MRSVMIYDSCCSQNQSSQSSACTRVKPQTGCLRRMWMARRVGRLLLIISSLRWPCSMTSHAACDAASAWRNDVTKASDHLHQQPSVAGVQELLMSWVKCDVIHYSHSPCLSVRLSLKPSSALLLAHVSMSIHISGTVIIRFSNSLVNLFYVHKFTSLYLQIFIYCRLL